jgi:tRNA pseudouridine synthase 10
MQSVLFDFDGSFSIALSEQLAERTRSALALFEFDSFLLGCSFPYALSEDEKALLKKDFQFLLVKKLEALLQKQPDFSNPVVQIAVDFNARKVSFSIQSLFIEGRYNKFSREIAQTVFYCPKCKGKGCPHCKGKGKLGLETVEELVGKPAQELSGAVAFAFHGAGREDVDVRMLGKGRAFVLELLEPRIRSIDLKKLEEKINSEWKGKIVVRGLHFSNRKRVGELKEGRHFKEYGCLVSCENSFSLPAVQKLLNKEITVQQQTPLRVLKRRTDMVRPRKVTLLRCKKVSEKEFELDVLAEAGLYIKEFIHGDGGRTQPSLSSLLGTPCNCRQLDVLEILENALSI